MIKVLGGRCQVKFVNGNNIFTILKNLMLCLLEGWTVSLDDSMYKLIPTLSFDWWLVKTKSLEITLFKFGSYQKQDTKNTCSEYISNEFFKLILQDFAN